MPRKGNLLGIGLTILGALASLASYVIQAEQMKDEIKNEVERQLNASEEEESD